jgi:hypothetical protein
MLYLYPIKFRRLKDSSHIIFTINMRTLVDNRAEDIALELSMLKPV